jgi:sulfur carrier protein ThiS
MNNSKKIKVKLTFNGVIDIKNIKNNSFLDIVHGTSIGDVLVDLGIRKEHKRFIITIVNDKKQPQTYVLNDGDHLSLFLPVGGG